MSSPVSNLGMLNLQSIYDQMFGAQDQAAATPAVDPASPAAQDPAQVSAFKANNPNGFDANWYLNAYPDVKASGTDPLQHYLQFGMKEGRSPNAYQAAEQIAQPNVAAKTNLGNTPDGSGATLDASDPASWASWMGKARKETQGLNNLPNVAPSSASLTDNPLAMAALFYPHGNDTLYVQRLKNQATGNAAPTTANLGMLAFNNSRMNMLG